MPPPGNPFHPGMQAAWGPSGGPNEAAGSLEDFNRRRAWEEDRAARDAAARSGLEDLVLAFLAKPPRQPVTYLFSIFEPTRLSRGEHRRPRWWKRKALEQHPHGRYAGHGRSPHHQRSFRFHHQVFETEGWLIPCTVPDDGGDLKLILGVDGVFLTVRPERRLVVDGHERNARALYSADESLSRVCDRTGGFSASCLADFFSGAASG